MTRQRKAQIKWEKQGLCGRCPEHPEIHKAGMCKKCYAKRGHKEPGRMKQRRLNDLNQRISNHMEWVKRYEKEIKKMEGEG